MEAATGWISKLGGETEKFATKGVFVVGVMDSLGIGGLATAGSLAAVVAQMRALGQCSLDMKERGGETGVTVDWLNAWSHAGLTFGVSADSIRADIHDMARLTKPLSKHGRYRGEIAALART